MKKIIMLVLSFVLLIPVNALAEECNQNGITINSIKMIEKSDGVVEVTKAQVKGKELDLDLSFTRLNNYIKYLINIENNTEDDYVLDESMFNKSYENVEYIFETNDKVVKAKSTKELILNVKLKNDIAVGIFSEVNRLNLGLTSGKIENPPTGAKTLLYYLPVLLIIGFIVFYASNKNKKFKSVAIILALIIIPSIVKATCKCELIINSKIKVENCNYKIVTNKGSFNNNEDVKEVCLGKNEIVPGSSAKLNFVDPYRTYWDNTNNIAFVIVERNSLSDDGRPTFEENSYIKVYSDSAKNNLIKTITKEDVPSHYYYNFEFNDYLDYYFEIEIGSYNEIYLEQSSDLINKIELDIIYGNHNNINQINLSDDEILNSIVAIDKIANLKSSVKDDRIFSLKKCSEMSPDYKNEYCNSSNSDDRIYHVIWASSIAFDF